MQQSFCLCSVVGFHLAQEDAVIVEDLAGVLAELFEQIVHGHLAAGKKNEYDNAYSAKQNGLQNFINGALQVAGLAARILPLFFI